MKIGRDYESAADRLNEDIDFMDIQTKEDYEKQLAKQLGMKPTQSQLDAFFGTRNTQNKIGFAKDSIFRRAGGRDLSRDRLRTAKVTTSSVKEYIRLTAQKSDLIGLDTALVFGFNKQNQRRKIDTNRTRVVDLKPTFQSRTKSGQVFTVKRKTKFRVYIFDTKGTRLGFTKK